MPLNLECQIIESYPMLTGDEIAQKLKVGRYAVYYCLHKNGIKLNRSGTRNGNIPWNKGIKDVCKSNGTSFKKGNTPWNKGLSAPKESIKKMKDGLQIWCKEKGHYPNWKGGISRAYKTGYNSIQYKEWRAKVFERDDYICQDCGIHASEVGYLTAHHIKSWSEYPELRFKVNNGSTLYEKCHSKVDRYRARFKREVN